MIFLHVIIMQNEVFQDFDIQTVKLNPSIAMSHSKTEPSFPFIPAITKIYTSQKVRRSLKFVFRYSELNRLHFRFFLHILSLLFHHFIHYM